MRIQDGLAIVSLALIFSGACSLSKNTEQNPNHTHNSQTSLSWQGVYRGVLPCADCEGIQTMIHLKNDLTYIKSTQYLGKSSELLIQNGSFQWNKEGTIITLMPWEKEDIQETTSAKPSANQLFLVGENQIVLLDDNGKRVQGPLEKNYILIKQALDTDIREKYWKLIELQGKAILPNDNQKRETHFVLRTKDQRIIGHGGCNAFSGAYELLEGNKIRFTSLSSTEMACATIEYETDFFKAIQACDNYSIKGDTLSLNKARMAPLARLVAVYFK